MAVTELQQSVFIHIPKCAGRSISTVLKRCVDGATYIGRPAGTDAHKTPDIGDKIAILFVRHPVLMLNSLWEHRRREGWNWQKNIELEHGCGCDNLEKFFERIVKNPRSVSKYYDRWITPYSPRTMIGKVENIQQDLIAILEDAGEVFNPQQIKNKLQKNKIRHTSNKKDLKTIMNTNFDLINQIMLNEERFYHNYGYSTEELHVLVK